MACAESGRHQQAKEETPADPMGCGGALRCRLITIRILYSYSYSYIPSVRF